MLETSNTDGTPHGDTACKSSPLDHVIVVVVLVGNRPSLPPLPTKEAADDLLAQTTRSSKARHIVTALILVDVVMVGERRMKHHKEGTKHSSTSKIFGDVGDGGEQFHVANNCEKIQLPLFLKL